ncbi:MAG: hypothetical protein QM775_33105 [Pirellulales bacterium]
MQHTPTTIIRFQTMHQVTDDSGFLALVVPTTYPSFVDSDWTLDQIVAHFKTQMARRSLLIWGTGLEGRWNVEVVLTPTTAQGFREVTGPLHVVGGHVLLSSYDSLTMAAQFDDVVLPEKHEQHLLLPVPEGAYACRIIQMFDPDDFDYDDSSDTAHFIIELTKTSADVAPWTEIPWNDSRL